MYVFENLSCLKKVSTYSKLETDKKEEKSTKNYSRMMQNVQTEKYSDYQKSIIVSLKYLFAKENN